MTDSVMTAAGWYCVGDGSNEQASRRRAAILWTRRHPYRVCTHQDGRCSKSHL